MPKCLTGLSLTLALAAGARARMAPRRGGQHNVNARVANQRARIAEGQADGQLTNREAR